MPRGGRGSTRTGATRALEALEGAPSELLQRTGGGLNDPRAKAPADARLQFGEFVLDPAARELLRDGGPVALSPKSFQVLALLASHPGELISKHRLLEEVWADVHVQDGVVKVCIAEIRRALGETAASPRHLHTVQRRGYRFDGPVVRDGDDAPRKPPTGALLRQLTVVSYELPPPAPSEDPIESILHPFGGQRVGNGDGPPLLCFGYPTSHEDDALRALRACFRVRERTAPGAARLGVHTGPAVVGGGSEPSLGETAAVAAALRAAADPGAVWVSEATRALVRDAVELEEVEPLSSGVRAFRALGPRLLEAEADPLETTGRTPMVGREQELGLLLDRWERAREGQGQAVLVSGEAGMGKSRLVGTLRERIASDPHAWLELRGSAYHRNSAFYPVIELLRRAFGLSADDAPAAHTARLERGLEQTGLPIDETLPLFAHLLALPLASDAVPLQQSPELLRRRTLEAMCAWLFATAERRPVVLAAEDLHWTDPSTVELLGMLMESGPGYPLLVLATHRPEFVQPWARSQLVMLPLHALAPREVDAMIGSLAGETCVPPSVREHVRAKADGVPLFVEEITRSLLESEVDLSRGDADPLRGAPVPSTLQDSLEARLDRLGPARELAQLAAALGREFPHALLEAVAPQQDDSLEEALAALLAAGLLFRRGVSSRRSWSFKHALIQETAYASLLPAARRDVHARIARALEERFPERVDGEPEGVARHYEEAGLVPQAIDAYARAGARAAARSADREAIAHFESALRLLAGLPESPERDQQEIGLRVAIGAPLVAARGFGSPEVEETYGRARRLSQELGERGQLVEALEGLTTFYISQSRLDEAREIAEQQLALAGRLEEPARLLDSHYCLAAIHYFRGDPARALQHFEQVDALYDPARDRDLLSIRGERVGVAYCIWSAWALWIHGYPDRALAACEQALLRAKDAGHLFSLAYAHAWASVVRWNRRERRETLEHAEACIAIAEEHGFPIPLGVARLTRLRCLPDGALDDALLAEWDRTLAELAATGVQAAVPQILGGISEFCLERGDADAASRYLEAAFAVSSRTGQPHWDAELHRGRGRLSLARHPDRPADAEACFREAAEIAARQQARSLELRAVSDLARLLRDQGRREEARAALADVHAGFSEGAGTEDLTLAGALLDELGGG